MSSKRDAADSATGKVIEVGGERIHIVDTGRADGPSLLLSTGLGGAWFDWRPTVDLLRADHRVICFDRPGLGGSPVGHNPPSLRKATDLLAALAEWAGAPVLVLAHSIAAFHAEALARIRPELVAGLVLVDPSCERSRKSGVRVSAAVTPVAHMAGRLIGLTGLPWLFGPWAYRLVLHSMSERGPAVPSRVIRSVYGRGDVMGTVIAEYFAYRETAADLAALRTRRGLPAIPLTVLTALGDVSGRSKTRWASCHARLTRMSPHGRQVRLADCAHMIQLDRPEAIADAVTAITRQWAEGIS